MKTLKNKPIKVGVAPAELEPITNEGWHYTEINSTGISNFLKKTKREAQFRTKTMYGLKTWADKPIIKPSFYERSWSFIDSIFSVFGVAFLIGFIVEGVYPFILWIIQGV